MEHLERSLAELGKRHGGKLYLDSHCDLGFMTAKVFIHGDESLVNLLVIKHIRWQHENLSAWEGYIYPYPVKEMTNG